MLLVAAQTNDFLLGDMQVRVIDIEALLVVKDFVRRPKDLEVAAELRALRDAAAKR